MESDITNVKLAIEENNKYFERANTNQKINLKQMIDPATYQVINVIDAVNKYTKRLTDLKGELAELEAKKKALEDEEGNYMVVE